MLHRSECVSSFHNPVLVCRAKIASGALLYALLCTRDIGQLAAVVATERGGLSGWLEGWAGGEAAVRRCVMAREMLLAALQQRLARGAGIFPVFLHSCFCQQHGLISHDGDRLYHSCRQETLVEPAKATTRRRCLTCWSATKQRLRGRARPSRWLKLCWRESDGCWTQHCGASGGP